MGRFFLKNRCLLQDLFKFETLKSDRFANKNGSLTKDDFATIKVGMPYLDLLNTVGIPDEIYASGLLGYGEAPSFTYRLSDSQTVQIHFDSRQTIKGYQIERGSDHTSFPLHLQHSKKSAEAF